MAIDPKQTKIVVALVVVLIAAVGITAGRIKSGPSEPTEQTNAAGPAAPERREVALARVSTVRNPFKVPDSLKFELSDAAEPVNAGGKRTGISTGKRPQSGDDGPVEPMPVPGTIGTYRAVPSSGARTNLDETKKAGPVFTLLATMQGPGGLSAIIKAGDSKERVVNVGDSLDDGYKVKRLEANRAVLTNGRDTIIAKRPQS